MNVWMDVAVVVGHVRRRQHPLRSLRGAHAEVAADPETVHRHGTRGVDLLHCRTHLVGRASSARCSSRSSSSTAGGCRNTASTAWTGEPKEKYYALRGWKRLMYRRILVAIEHSSARPDDHRSRREARRVDGRHASSRPRRRRLGRAQFRSAAAARIGRDERGPRLSRTGEGRADGGWPDGGSTAGHGRSGDRSSSRSRTAEPSICLRCPRTAIATSPISCTARPSIACGISSTCRCCCSKRSSTGRADASHASKIGTPRHRSIDPRTCPARHRQRARGR